MTVKNKKAIITENSLQERDLKNQLESIKKELKRLKIIQLIS